MMLHLMSADHWLTKVVKRSEPTWFLLISVRVKVSLVMIRPVMLALRVNLIMQMILLLSWITRNRVSVVIRSSHGRYCRVVEETSVSSHYQDMRLNGYSSKGISLFRVIGP
jgi:hypothetical protein